MVDWQFLPQNFGQVVGTYEGLLWLSECTWGDDSTLRWWGHFNITLCNQTFLFQVVGTLKPSIQYILLPFTPFAPSPPLHSPLLPFTPFAPLSSSPLAPTEVVGTQLMINPFNLPYFVIL